MIYTPVKNLPVRSPSDTRDTVDVAAFSRYLYRRRNVPIVASLVALALAAAVSLLLPKKYTATASILIEPPAGNDPRGATAISPIYLESLRTYERFATSDSLFQQALGHLQLRNRYSGIPVETLKAQVLKVLKPKDTKILEISATLDDRVKAQQFAKYIAEQTVAINRSLETASTRDLGVEAEVLVQAARTRVEHARRVREAYVAHEPIAALEAELTGTTDLRFRVDRDLVDTRVELAAYEARDRTQTSERRQAVDSTGFRGEIAAAQAAISALERQSQDLINRINTDTALLERRKHERELLDKELQAAQSQYEAAMNRDTEILSSQAFRGERLEIVDPGVVPERPSSPNVSLNLLVALLASATLSVLYLALSFGYSRIQPSTDSDEDER